MTIRCLIVDDEPQALKILQRYIKQVPKLELIGQCADALQANEWLQKEKIDLIFLDINMPKLSGISLVRSLSNPPLIVFTTAYPEYAVEGFEVEALDYLLKPFSFERFLKAVNKAVVILEQQRGFPGELKPAGILLVKADRKLYRVPYEDILYLQAYGDYVKIVTREQHIAAKETLHHFEQTLPKDVFLRVHRSFIVALTAVRYLEGNHLRVAETNIPIGESYREKVLSLIKNSG